MKTITIDVTQEDIDKGVCKDTAKCAIARAFGRMLDGESIQVGSYSIALYNHSVALNLPEEASEFVKSFDKYKGTFVKPFSFQLDMSDELYARLFGDLNKDKLVDDAACIPPTPVRDKISESVPQI